MDRGVRAIVSHRLPNAEELNTGCSDWLECCQAYIHADDCLVSFRAWRVVEQVFDHLCATCATSRCALCEPQQRAHKLIVTAMNSHAAARSSATAAPKDDLGGLYGVGGELYTFVHQARNDYQGQQQWSMAKRASELLDKIARHDAEVETIARRITEECKCEFAEPVTTTAAGSDGAWREWFDRMGDKASADVVNATANLVTNERLVALTQAGILPSSSATTVAAKAAAEEEDPNA